MRTYSLASILVIGLSVPTAQATLIQATYQISASNFQDSNSNPSVAPTSTVVTGSYQFTFDTQFVVQIGIVPDPGGSTTALGNILEIVNSNNSVIGFDQTKQIHVESLHDGRHASRAVAHMLVKCKVNSPHSRRHQAVLCMMRSDRRGRDDAVQRDKIAH